MTPPSVAQAIYDQTLHKAKEMVDYYSGNWDEHIEVRHLEKLDAILDAEDRREAEQRAKEAIDKIFMTMMSLWTTKKIFGPKTAENFEKRAKVVESFAKWQEQRGNDEAAEKVRLRAAALKEKAQKLRDQPEPVKAPPKKTRKRRAS